MCIAHNINKMYILFYFFFWRNLATYYYVKEQKLIKISHLNFNNSMMTLFIFSQASFIINETATAWKTGIQFCHPPAGGSNINDFYHSTLLNIFPKVPLDGYSISFDKNTYASLPITLSCSTL